MTVDRPTLTVLQPPPVDSSFDPGDRVAAARDLETSEGLYIPAGSVGTITEDRESAFLVFFHHQTPPTKLQQGDLRSLIDAVECRFAAVSVAGESVWNATARVTVDERTHDAIQKAGLS